jgi:Flp pilus assembly protein TadD
MPGKRPFFASRWSAFLGAGLIALAGLIVYKNSFFVPFVFDDGVSITKNPTIRHLWPLQTVLFPPSGTTVSGRPVINYSLAVNYAWSGMAGWSYHLLNLVIHVLAGMTLFGVVRRTLLQPVLRGRFGNAARPLALAVAVLWTIHPLQTESVTCVVQRTESLMGLFYLLTLYCFVRGAESRSQASGVRHQVSEVRNQEKEIKTQNQEAALHLTSGLTTDASRLWYTASVLCCALGMASKEVMVSAPLIVLLYDRTFVAGTFGAAWRQRWRLYLGLGSTWLLLAYLMMGTHHRGDAVGFGLGVTGWEYALTQCQAIVHYLRLSFWPQPLILDYGMDVVKHPGAVVPQALLLILLVAGTLVGLWRWPAVGFAGLWFFAILAPSSSVVPIATQTIAEHRMYLPLAAVLVLLVTGLYACAGKKSAVVFVALAAWWGSLTVQRNEDYRSELGIWRDTVEKRPDNPRAHSTLGQLLQQSGQLPEAIAQDKEALRLKPDYAQAHNNLGVALCEAGKIPEGVAHYQEALRLQPNFAEACYNLGATLQLAGRNAEAIHYFERALELNPEYMDARTNLGIALAVTGKVSEAAEQFGEVLRQNPDSAEAHVNLAMALTQMGRKAEAIQQYEEALRLNPDYDKARSHLEQLRAAQSPSLPGANEH